MPRKQPNLSPPKTALEKRAEVKDYIRNERDTILMKWRCLEENVATMDRQSETFKARLERQSSKRIPLNIQKFINTLKRKVRKTIQAKGGTPFGIVRALFLYWGTSGSASNAKPPCKRTARCKRCSLPKACSTYLGRCRHEARP